MAAFLVDFFLGAFPFLSIGLCLAVLCSAPQKWERTYFSEGMCLGLAAGCACAAWSSVELGVGIGLGILAGMGIGILIQKKPE